METLSYCQLMERCIALEAEVAELKGYIDTCAPAVNLYNRRANPQNRLPEHVSVAISINAEGNP